MTRFLRTRGQRKAALTTTLVLTFVTINVVAFVIAARDFRMLNPYIRIDRTPAEWFATGFLFIEGVVVFVLGVLVISRLIIAAIDAVTDKVNQWINRGA
jgi:hypothetical protein